MVRRLWTLAVAGALFAGLASEASAGIVYGTGAVVGAGSLAGTYVGVCFVTPVYEGGSTPWLAG